MNYTASGISVNYLKKLNFVYFQVTEISPLQVSAVLHKISLHKVQ